MDREDGATAQGQPHPVLLPDVPQSQALQALQKKRQADRPGVEGKRTFSQRRNGLSGTNANVALGGRSTCITVGTRATSVARLYAGTPSKRAWTFLATSKRPKGFSELARLGQAINVRLIWGVG
jgi:hypothetical protein